MQDVVGGLESIGLTACHYDIRSSDPPRELLTVYAGADDLDNFIHRVVAATQRADAEWAPRIARLAQCLIPHIDVHRCKSWDTMRLRDYLDATLDIPISCHYHPDHEDSGVIGAPRNAVDRVLESLRSC